MRQKSWIFTKIRKKRLRHSVSGCVRHFAVVLRRLNSMAELSDFLPYVRRQISGPLNIMMTDAL
ncbi:hypothetical protein ACFMGP_004935, partial [Escherichia coli]